MTAPWRFLPCDNCCEEECLILHDPLAGPELSSAWEVVSGDTSFVNGYLRVTSQEAMILSTAKGKTGNAGLQVTFKGYAVGDEVRLIFDYHSPNDYKYALVQMVETFAGMSRPELRQVIAGEDSRFSPSVQIWKAGYPALGINYTIRLVIEPDRYPGLYRVSLVGPNNYAASTDSIWSGAWCAFRACVSITSDVVGIGTGRTTQPLDLRDVYRWTPVDDYQWPRSLQDVPASCPRGPDFTGPDSPWGEQPGAWLLEFASDSSQVPKVVYWSYAQADTLVWAAPRGARGSVPDLPRFEETHVGALWHFAALDSDQNAYTAVTPAGIDRYAGITLTDRAGVTCLARAVTCEEA